MLSVVEVNNKSLNNGIKVPLSISITNHAPSLPIYGNYNTSSPDLSYQTIHPKGILPKA